MARRNRQMCVRIAQDVLTQLRLQRYKATPRTYVKLESEELDAIAAEDESAYESALKGSFKDFFKKNKKTTCQVCAIGAAFVSLVNIENKCSVDGICHKEGMWKRLEKHFGGNNMDLMESAFECVGRRSARTTMTFHVAGEWGSQYEDPAVRLRAIMLNVIRNKGDFKLPQKYLSRARRLEKEYAL
ncbi:MAG: hypothetical protein MN733_11915 [Nitrososphaera sp.]|nr:hypothetical protein [Nitrososphaera sp.]